MKIHKTQFSFDSRWKNLKFNLKRGRGHLLSYIMNRIRWDIYPSLGYTSRFPDHVDIEITNKCQLRCPMCYRYKLKNTGFMGFNLYKKIIDECAAHKIYSIRLSWRGEPLLHPKMIEMIKYAKTKGIKEASFLTNGVLLGKLAEELVEAGVDWITVSFDGLGKMYEKIRYPAKYRDTLNNIKKVQKIKKKLGKVKPVLKVQTVWHAVKEDPKAYVDVFDPIVDKISCNPTKDYSKKINHDPDFICPKTWERLVITWKGKVVQCICDVVEENVMGDVNTTSIKDIWRSEKMGNVRRLHRKKQRLKLAPCRKCLEGEKMKPVVIKTDRKLKVEMFDDEDKDWKPFDRRK